MDQTLKRLIEEAAFRETRKGYDRGEVDDFLDRAASMAGKVEGQLAQAIERGRAAETQLKRLEAEREVLAAGRPETPAEAPAPAPAAPSEDVTEEVARTLVLAQRTADAAIAEARQDAERILSEAQAHAEAALAAADADAAGLREQASSEAEQHRHEARDAVAAEVRALSEAREALREDMGLIEQHVEARQAQLHSVLEEMHRLLDGISSGRVEIPPLPGAVDDAYDDAAYDDEAAYDDGDGEAYEDEVGEHAEHESGDQAHAEAVDVPHDEHGSAGGNGAGGAISYEGWHDVASIDEPAARPAEPAEAPRVVITDIDHEVPGGEHDVDPGPPTQQISAAELDLGGPPSRTASDEDEFLAELRKAIHDDEPLGPAGARDAHASDPRDHLFDHDDRRGKGRFGRRR